MAKARKTVAEIVDVLAAETQAIEKLRQRRQTLEKEIDSLAREIAALRGVGAPVARPKVRPKKRAARKKVSAKEPVRRPGRKTLRSAIAEILGKSGKAMRAAEIAEQLPKVGYKSTSKNLKALVSFSLPKTKEFRRVRKGLYALRKQ